MPRERGQPGDPRQVQSCLQLVQWAPREEAGGAEGEQSACSSEWWPGVARQGCGEGARPRTGRAVGPPVGLALRDPWPGRARLGEAGNQEPAGSLGQGPTALVWAGGGSWATDSGERRTGGLVSALAIMEAGVW